MTAGARRGVLAAMGLELSFHDRHQSVFARCGLCHDDLSFSTGDYGQTLERCGNIACPNHVPHHPIAATMELPSPRKQGHQGRRQGPDWPVLGHAKTWRTETADAGRAMDAEVEE